MKVLLSSLQTLPFSTPASSSSSNDVSKSSVSIRRRAKVFGPSVVSSPLLNFCTLRSFSATARQRKDELQQEEDSVVHLFQETSPSVVSIKDLELAKIPKSSSNEAMSIDDDNAKVEGICSGFIWDKFDHIVTNYHVASKVATDQNGLHHCKEGKDGYDPAYDVAALKVRAALQLGILTDLKTLTTGIVSGLGWEIPSPNGKDIRGAIQTEAAINSGNSGGPLIDSYGHVIGVSTATFACKGTGLSS